MAKLVKCPVCELNYITENQKHCKFCDPKMRRNSITDEVEKTEQEREERLEKYSKRKEEMNAFLAIRYNCRHK